MNLSPDEQLELEDRHEAARSKLFFDHERLLDICDKMDTAELFYRLSGEFRSDYFDMDIDRLEKLAGIDHDN